MVGKKAKRCNLNNLNLIRSVSVAGTRQSWEAEYNFVATYGLNNLQIWEVL